MPHYRERMPYCTESRIGSSQYIQNLECESLVHNDLHAVEHFCHCDFQHVNIRETGTRDYDSQSKASRCDGDNNLRLLHFQQQKPERSCLQSYTNAVHESSLCELHPRKRMFRCYFLEVPLVRTHLSKIPYHMMSNESSLIAQRLTVPKSIRKYVSGFSVTCFHLSTFLLIVTAKAYVKAKEKS